MYSIPYLEVWSQCYFRWIPHLIIKNGGKIQVEILARLLQKDLFKLDTNNSCSSVNSYVLSIYRMQIDSFFPFTHKNSDVVENFAVDDSSFVRNENLVEGHILPTALD